MRNLVIILILILNVQIVSSQTVVTDTVKKTITLSKLKKIDVAKIIVNEEKLFQEVKTLRSLLTDADLIIVKLENKNKFKSKIILENKTQKDLQIKNFNDLYDINKSINKQLKRERRKKWFWIGGAVGVVVLSQALN